MTATKAPGIGLRRVEPLWGTAITLDIRCPVAPALADEVYAWFRRVDDLFSTWRADSEVSRLGRDELSLDQASPEVNAVLGLCERVRSESGGAFDIRYAADPRVAQSEGRGPIDPSGLVKGWALQRAAEVLNAHGVADFSINAGGDVIASGHPRSGEPWRVGIQHPWQRDKVAAVVGVSGLGVATSGRYERGDHIIDPRTGRPAQGLQAVTVVAEDLALADGYATAALVLGGDGMAWLDRRPGISAMAISNDGTVTTTAGFADLRIS